MLVTLLILTASFAEPPPAAVTEALKSVLAVGREGTGNEAAAEGWKTLVAAGPEALLPTLSAFDGATPTAENWLRAAVSAIVAKQPPEAEPMLAFVRETSHNPAARRIAYELAAEADSNAATSLLKTLTDDPSRELRRDAIAANLTPDTPASELSRLFTAARDPDQCEELAKRLEAAGKPVDLPGHYGLMTEWLVLGPLHAPEDDRIHHVYAPEAKSFDPNMTAEGQDGIKLTWKPVQASTPAGQLDLNQVLEKVPDSVAYLVATIEAPAARSAQVRVTCTGAIKVFVNGEAVLARDAYHQGTPWDQYTGPIELKAGRNVVVLKVCQNNAPQPWAKEWKAAARLCDETGGRLPLTQIHTAPDGTETRHPLGRLAPAPTTSEEKN